MKRLLICAGLKLRSERTNMYHKVFLSFKHFLNNFVVLDVFCLVFFSSKNKYFLTTTNTYSNKKYCFFFTFSQSKPQSSDLMKPNFNILSLQNAVCKEKLKLHHLDHIIPPWQYYTTRIIFFSSDGENWPRLDGITDAATYRSIPEIGGQRL